MADMQRTQRGRPGGRIYYDADCAMCSGIMRRVGGPLRRRGFTILSLRDAGAGADLGVAGPALLEEMRLKTTGGHVFGGADALCEMARRVWWAWPLWAISRLPGMLPLLRLAYRYVAARRSCSGAAACELRRRP